MYSFWKGFAGLTEKSIHVMTRARIEPESFEQNWRVPLGRANFPAITMNN